MCESSNKWWRAEVALEKQVVSVGVIVCKEERGTSDRFLFFLCVDKSKV